MVVETGHLEEKITGGEGKVSSGRDRGDMGCESTSAERNGGKGVRFCFLLLLFFFLRGGVGWGGGVGIDTHQ